MSSIDGGTQSASLSCTEECWLRLCLVPGITPAVQRRLLAALGSPASVLGAPTSAVAAIAGAAAARALSAGPDAREIRRALAWLRAPGRFLLTWSDADYPARLLEIPDPPPILYAAGRRELLHRRALAVVGSRNASRQGEEDAYAFSLALSRAGLCVVSGLALGVDAAAHAGGLAGDGASIAILGNGPDTVYPAANGRLAERIAREGLVLTEHAPGVPPLARHFPRRNRLISGLGIGVLVVEAAARSGSLVTARLALDQGRDVFAIPGSIHSPLAKGCHALIKQGAALVECADDVLAELAIAPAACAVETGPDKSGHADCLPLGHAPASVDALVRDSGKSAGEVLTRLAELELAGAIERLAGGFYRRVRQAAGRCVIE